jgi:hypothetical protein
MTCTFLKDTALSGAKKDIDPDLTCPVCFISEFNNSEDLNAHVENHFNDSTPSKYKNAFSGDLLSHLK